MQKNESLWVVIHMAHSQERADQALELLTREGFMVKVRPVNRALGAEACYEVLALNSEAKEARDLLHEMGF